MNVAKDLLNYFVRNCTEHYGNTFCVYNVHGLVHITDDVECKSKINTKVTIKPKDNCFLLKKGLYLSIIYIQMVLMIAAFTVKMF